MVSEGGDYLLYQFSPKKVECQSEPPWIKRCNYGIKFTDDKQFEEDIEFCPSSERNIKKDETSDEEATESRLKIVAKVKTVSEKGVSAKDS
jgi:hypothetical protein